MVHIDRDTIEGWLLQASPLLAILVSCVPAYLIAAQIFKNRLGAGVTHKRLIGFLLIFQIFFIIIFTTIMAIIASQVGFGR